MKNVIFIGDVALDEYYEADRLPEIKDKLTVRTLPAQVGGSIANAACVYAGYGEKVKFSAVLNDSPVSQMLCSDLEKANVDTSLVVTDNSLPDSKCIIILAEDEHMVIIPTMNVEKLMLTDEMYEEVIHSDIIYSNIHEITVLKNGNKNALQIVKNAKKNGTIFAFDLDVAEFRHGEVDFLPLIDILFVNEVGLRNLLDGRSQEDVFAELFANGTKMIVTTLADNGVSIFHDGVETHVNGVTVPVVDVTGAGDTFCSSFVYAYTATNDVRISAKFANYAAARSVTIMGARGGVTSKEELFNFIKEVGGDSELIEIQNSLKGDE